MERELGYLTFEPCGPQLGSIHMQMPVHRQRMLCGRGREGGREEGGGEGGGGEGGCRDPDLL